MECLACGFENRPDARFCKRCGEPLPTPEETPAPQQPQDVICPYCGATARSGARFCPRCGKQLLVEPSKPSPPSTQPSMPAPIEIPTQPSMPAASMPSEPSPPPDQPPGGYAQPPSQPPPPPTTPPRPERQFPRWLLWIGGAALFLCLVALVVTAVTFGPDLLGAGEEPTASPVPPATTAPEEPSPAFAARVGIDVPTDTVRLEEPLIVTVTLTNTGEVPVSNLSYQLVGEWASHLESTRPQPVRRKTTLPPNASDTVTFELRPTQEGEATLQAYVAMNLQTDPPSTKSLLSEEILTVAVVAP